MLPYVAFDDVLGDPEVYAYAWGCLFSTVFLGPPESPSGYQGIH